jgi:hypothetical protein
MFRPHHGICSNPECQKECIIVVKAGLCIVCNHRAKQAKKKAAGKKSSGYKYVRKATGEKETFHEVLDMLPEDETTKCFVCGKLISVVTHHNFAHILAKGKYASFRNNPENIRIMCYNINGTGCHTRYDFYPKSELTDPMWDKVWELKTQLIEEYKRIKS